MYKSFIKIRTEFAGIHCYPDAPDEVAYLRQPHRHLFKVIAQIQVYSDDRELEFIIVKKDLHNALREEKLAFKQTASCEQMAEQIRAYLAKRWITNNECYRDIIVEVNEDGENGAVVGTY